MSFSVLKVSQFVKYVKSVIEYDSKLREIFVKGEISEFRMSFSGHAYFTLKDEASSVRCVMFSKNVDFLSFIPEEGMECIVRGYAGIYEAGGAFMLYAQDITKCGQGEGSKNLKNLKDRLSAEGYFDSKYKKPIPFFPKRVGVVTSLQGAALGDIKKTIASRCPSCKIVVSPAAVQGNLSPESICYAIDRIAKDGFCDVVIVGRGGGSAEDLSSFNSESVVKAVFKCPVPVISAVGHERDVTLCDLTADLRAATPTAAAAAAVPDVKNLKNQLGLLKEDLAAQFYDSIEFKKYNLSKLKENKYLEDIAYSIENKKLYVDELKTKMVSCFNLSLDKKKRELAGKMALMDAYSPLKVLQRGFSYVENEGKPVFSASSINEGDRLTINFNDGSVIAEAKSGKV